VCPELDDAPVEHPVQKEKGNARATGRTKARIRRNESSYVRTDLCARRKRFRISIQNLRCTSRHGTSFRTRGVPRRILRPPPHPQISQESRNFQALARPGSFDL